MEKKRESVEKMVIEMITFLKKWGLWQNTRIFACGDAFDSTEEEDEYHGIIGVKVVKNVDPADYVESPYGDEEPFEHVFDMTFESALCEVFDEGVLRTDYGMIEGEAWDFVFANSRFLADYLESELSWDRDIEEVLSDIISENAGAEEYTLWDPLEYEDFNEYQKHHDTGSEKECATPLYTLFDTYENYQQFMKGEFSLLRQSPVLWDMVASHAKNRFSGELSDVQTEIEGEVVTNIMNEFGAIFKKYGLDYTQLYSWMIVGESDS